MQGRRRTRSRQEMLGNAAAAFERALALQPRLVDAGNNLGMTYQAMKRYDEAIATWRRMTALRRISWFITTSGGRCASATRWMMPSMRSETAFASAPISRRRSTTSGTFCAQAGRIEEAIAEFDHAVQIQPKFQVAHSNRLYTMYYQPGIDARALLAEHRKWNEIMARPLAASIAPHGNERIASRRLKIGYVSPNFWGHCQSLFTSPLFANHDHEEFEIYCYSDVKANDATTEKIKGYCDQWRSIVGMSDEQAAEQIRRDGIDILVDLTLHMAENRTLLFAQAGAVAGDLAGLSRDHRSGDDGLPADRSVSRSAGRE